jgi:hypothetical protein
MIISALFLFKKIGKELTQKLSQTDKESASVATPGD